MQTLLNNKIASEMAPVTAKLAALAAAMGQAGGSGGTNGGTLDVMALRGLPAPYNGLYDDTINAFTVACTGVFWCSVAGGVCAFLAAICMEHIPLRGGAEHNENEAAAAAADGAKSDGLTVRVVDAKRAAPTISFGGH